MSKLVLSVCLAFAFFVASAVAQMAPGGSQGTQNSSPTMSQPGSQPGDRQGQEPGMSTDQNTTAQNQNHEHKMKGCVQSQGGQYMLETKKGKDIALSGQDVSAHVGHEVSVKGTWEHGTSSATSTNASASGKTFNVTSVNMISDTCKMKGSSGNTGSSGTMGNSGSTSPGTGNNTPSGSGNGTQPPQ